MARKRYKPEEIVAKLRQVDVLVSQGQAMADATDRGPGGRGVTTKNTSHIPVTRILSFPPASASRGGPGNRPVSDLLRFPPFGASATLGCHSCGL